MHIAVTAAAMNANEPVETVAAREAAGPRELSDAKPPRAPRRSRTNPAGASAGAGKAIEPDGPSARVNELARRFARRIHDRPWTSLAVALGIGFVVGGALSFRAGRVALAAAARHVARGLLKQVL